MPPKKEEKKAKPSSTKIVADKASICPCCPPSRHTNACFLDFWHEKREPSHPNPPLLLNYCLVLATTCYADGGMTTEKRSTSPKANPTNPNPGRPSQNTRSETKRGRKSATRKRQSGLGTSKTRNSRPIQAGTSTKSAFRGGSEDGSVYILQARELREGEEV